MNHRRNNCRVCGSAELSPVIALAGYPLVAGPVTRVPSTVPTCNLEVGLCHGCGTYSLLNEDTDSLAYDDNYTSSSIPYGSTKSVDDQTDRFVKFIGRADKTQESKVLEIGCYDGALMEILETRYRFKLLGCEPCVPAADDARRKGYNVHPGVFNADNYSDLDLIVARNILEHIAFPNQFVRGVAASLKQNGAFALEVPAGEHYIRNGILGTIVPQHPCYFGKDSLKRLLENHFATVIAEDDRATIRALASVPCPSNNSKEVVSDITQLRTGERKRQTRYDAVRKIAGDGEVDLFGANTCALELIAAGAVMTEQVGRVYDDDPHRWGRYLVNTNLIVSPRSAIGEGERRKVLVCSYTHRQSIADYIAKQNNVAVKLYGDDE